MSLKSKKQTNGGRRARPTPPAYDPVHCTRIVAHAESGATVVDYADAIGVPPSTLIEWPHAHPEFLKALRLALATLGLKTAQQAADLRNAVLLRWFDIDSRLFATTDAAEADQLVRRLSDLAPQAWLGQAHSILAWFRMGASEKVGGLEP